MEVGTVAALTQAGGVHRLSIQAPRLAPHLAAGESVAVNGVCLSVVQVRRGVLVFEVISETRRVTNLGTLSAGSRVNLEPSLSLSDRLNGHLVLGHVDGVGRIVERRTQAGQVLLRLRMARALRRCVVPKGSLAVDGVSLTAGADGRSSTDCSVFLIPETIQKTTLGSRRVGDLVNLELDYVAKLILQQSWHYTVPLLKGMSKRNRHTEVDWGKRVGREAW